MPDDDPAPVFNPDSFGSGGVANPSSSSPLVYWGGELSKQEKVGLFLGGSTVGFAGKTLTVDEADGYFLSSVLSNPQLLDEYRKRFSDVGFDVSDNQKLRKAWQTAVNWASDSYVKGGRKITPWDAIDELGASNGGASDTAGVNKTRIENVNDTKVGIDLSSAQTARSYLEQAMQQATGRAPTSDEISNFREALNQMEQSNATVSRTTGTRASGSRETTTANASGIATEIAGGYSSDNTSTTQTGGMNREQYALDTAKSAGDYAEYQAATTYMDAMFRAIQSPVNT